MATTQTILIVLVVCAAVALRVYRQSKEQRWRIRRMWIVPALFLLITIAVVSIDTAQNIFAPLAGMAGLAVGIVVGLYQGNHTTLRIDKPNQAVFIKVTPIGSLIFVAILAARFALRFATVSADTSRQMASGAVPAASPLEVLLGSALLALAVGSIAGLRWYVQQRYDAAGNQ